MSERRNLHFHHLNDVLADLDKLEQSNITTSGNWSLYQILSHLSNSIEFSMTQYPHLLPLAVRRTVGKRGLKALLKNQEMQPGVQNPAAPQSREESDRSHEVQAFSALRKAIADFQAYDGPLAEHPAFGTVSKDEFEKVHAYHCALHLSFATIDKPSSKPATTTTPVKPAKKSPKKSSKKAAKKTTKKSNTKKTVKKPVAAKKSQSKAAKKTTR